MSQKHFFRIYTSLVKMFRVTWTQGKGEYFVDVIKEKNNSLDNKHGNAEL